MREIFSDLIQQLPHPLQHALFAVQHTFLSPHRLEHSYLIIMLVIALVVVTEKLRNPRRKLRNRSDRIAWGQR
jgi:hypothetical protein